MSKMLDRVAKAIELAQKVPRYVVKTSLEHYWELWDTEQNIKIKDSCWHVVIDNACDSLNAQNIARKAVEALKLEEVELNWLISQDDARGLVEWNKNLAAILAE